MSSDVYRQHLQERLGHCHVPEHLHRGLLEYLTERHPPGGFLDAVLCNDLAQAMRRADPESAARLREIVLFLYMFAPAGAWGSIDAVARWLTATQPVAEMFE